jgi:uncharacterized protein (TIGR00730 family)
VRICVYAGSSMGSRPEYREAARLLGELLAAEGIGLVYGGGSIGLMGTIANAVLAKGGEVIGVIPQALYDVGVSHAGLSELRVVPSMHERKAVMAELSSAFIALPGGIGTFEEVFEAWTWSQLGVHAKPIACLNICGFYDRLTEFLDHVVAEDFLKPVHRNVLIVEEDPAKLLAAVRRAEIPFVPKWVGLEKA